MNEFHRLRAIGPVRKLVAVCLPSCGVTGSGVVGHNEEVAMIPIDRVQSGLSARGSTLGIIDSRIPRRTLTGSNARIQPVDAMPTANVVGAAGTAGVTIRRARGREVLHTGMRRNVRIVCAIRADGVSVAGEAVLDAATVLTCCHAGAYIVVSA